MIDDRLAVLLRADQVRFAQDDPVPGFGAMETGEHFFYERKGDGPEKRVGRASFAMVWKLEDGVWKLHRVLSLGHKAAE